MHSLETGIIISIAAFFFLSFLTFTFMREVNISKEINEKIVSEIKEYKKDGDSGYAPGLINNIMNIIIEGGEEYVGENEK